MDDEVYCYPPDFKVLKNKFGLTDNQLLEVTEREITSVRMRQGCPVGEFDLAHLKAIHRHLFQDIYDWAGDIRVLEISKGGSQFLPKQFIETGMNNVHSRLVASNNLRGMSAKEFSQHAGQLMGDINHIHPFRDGNGRTQLQYLSQLSQQAGHDIDLTKLDPEAWVNASIRSHHGDYAQMQSSIYSAVSSNDEQTQDTTSTTPEDKFAKAFRDAQDRAWEIQQKDDHELE
jgi:cell filamentation protein